jgi:hypothetical protein
LQGGGEEVHLGNEVEPKFVCCPFADHVNLLFQGFDGRLFESMALIFSLP